ncbi:MAG: 3-deoxy-8-phosphooctulonate synthase [Chitinivibrionales bacterium]|nr:3-deoxy-8-phosphooctulonate synthase [Chitinivibrionales bacterium]
MTDEMLWIAGPCSVESYEIFVESAKKLHPTFKGTNWYLKGSFDKANRTAVTGRRGPGLEQTIEIFNEIKRMYPDIRIITDVHETHQVEPLADVVDAIQIPAFLCRQTDLLVESGRCFNYVNIKKGQWMSPQQTSHFHEKVKSQNPKAEVWITDRGTSFGYGNLIVDFGAAAILKKFCDKVIFDCTHSTQRIVGDFTRGDREMAKQYLLASVPFGFDGIFMETHPDPDTALSDSTCQVDMDDVYMLKEKYSQMKQAYLAKVKLASRKKKRKTTGGRK